MLTFPRSRISQPLAIAGGVHRRLSDSLARHLRRLGASLTGKLIVLVGIFVALPFALYGQLESGDAKLRLLVTRGIQQPNWLIAEALKPTLDRSGAAPAPAVKKQLARYGEDGTTLTLMFRPATRAPDRFYYLASVPPVNQSQLSRELLDFQSRGITPRLLQSCNAAPGDRVAHNDIDPQQGTQTSIIPVRTPSGCWALVISHSTAEFMGTSIGKPSCQSPQ